MGKNKDDFFKRKETKEIKLPEHGDYDPSNFDNDLASCGINDQEDFSERHVGLFNNLVVDSSVENPVATVARKIEKSFTHREVCFLLSKDLLQAAYEKSRHDLNDKK
tara:strand:+ start:3311 stop:3631 length:321 start_codon:yes stop_codon:yes gene_type:complete